MAAEAVAADLPVDSVYGQANTIGAYFYDFLVDIDVDQVLQPGLAEKWEIAPGGKSWLFTLRKGVKFHNGEEMTAHDWVAMRPLYEVGISATAARVRTFTQKEWVAVDNYTLRIPTKGIIYTFPYDISRGTFNLFWAASAKYLKEVGPEVGLKNKPIGTGPYRVVSRNPGDKIVLEVTPEAARGEHWRVTPGFARLELRPVAEASTRTAMVLTGQADIIDAAIASVPQIKAYPNLKITTSKLIAHSGVRLCCQGNGKSPYFSDIRVRKALAHAVDMDAIVNGVFKGYAIRTAVFGFNPAVAGFDPTLKPYAYDPALAARLLKEAEFPPPGFKLQLYASPGGGVPEMPLVAEAVASYWKQVGVSTEVRPNPGNLVQQILASNIGDIASASRASASREPTLVFQTTMGCTPRFQGVVTHRAVCSEVDDWMVDWGAEPEAAKRAEIAKKIQRWLYDNYPNIPIAGVDQVYAYGPKVAYWQPINALTHISNLEFAEPAR